MAWLGKAIDRAKAPGVSILHPMAPIADLLSKDRLTADERRVVDAHIATVQAEANQIGALARKMARAAKAKETARK